MARHFLAFGILLSCIATVLGTEQSSESAKIKQLLGAQSEAWNEGDIPRFMQTYWNSGQLTFSSGGSTTRGWKRTLERYQMRYSSKEKMGRLRFGQLEVSLLGEAAAMVLGTWHLKREGHPDMEGNFTLVLRKFGKDWKIIHDHTSLLRTTAASEQ